MPKTEKKLHEIYSTLVDSMIAKDTRAIDSIMMDSGHLVHINGYKQKKCEWLRAIETGKMKYYGAREECLEIMYKERSARVIARNIVDARIDGYRNVWSLELTIFLVKFGEEWMISNIETKMY
ncbi:nuclear transport factor 2 family protein [Macrococcoides canis]|uniref:nuclear transport factor 2 family protein n=1 Tax=Macrococcoides canis TaxID=1855823 RepID=UPI00207CF8EE|nr:nuclear transport factor 2 family protein [Macrococcus canis]MCO4096208.1 nuclear transport factor 2 family protein [Macrococcus canis]UTH09185.1 nuclear transport factor 2 family protein [Macrococcus canis]